jgi:hypothetical protein
MVNYGRVGKYIMRKSKRYRICLDASGFFLFARAGDKLVDVRRGEAGRGGWMADRTWVDVIRCPHSKPTVVPLLASARRARVSKKHRPSLPPRVHVRVWSLPSPFIIFIADYKSNGGSPLWGRLLT